MKTRLLITATILLLASPIWLKSQTPQYEWEYVSSMQNEWLRKVYAQGLDTVYVVGNDGLIAQSPDRALTWKKQYFPTKKALNDIIFVNHNIGFAVGVNGTILSTTDAGVSWTQLPSGVTPDFYAIAATGLDNIWAVGDSGLIVQSKDAGMTWTAIKLVSDSVNLFDVKFRDSIGYIAGNHSRVLKTTNGGADWVNDDITQRIDHPDYSHSDSYSLHSLSITDNKVYAIVSSNLMPLIGLAVSSEINSNNNWSLCESEYGYQIYATCQIRFFCDSIGYLGTNVGLSGVTVYKTVDGAKNWEEEAITQCIGTGVDVLNNFSFNSDNSVGYFHSKGIIIRTPYTGDFTSLNDLKSDSQTLRIKQQGGELQLSSLTKTISGIEIYSVTGAKICQKKGSVVNIQQMPSGVYFIGATYGDKSRSKFVKWIRR